MPLSQQSWPEGTTPVVSICCATFNHVNFIREAIDGFLMQETTFPVEILIHDDASSDGTSQILRDYQSRFPSLIHLIIQKENQFSKGLRPGVYLRGIARGSYIAVCEGDDYWTSAAKLEQQIDILESDLDLSGCFHNAVVRNEIKNSSDNLFVAGVKKEKYTIQDILVLDWFVPTASLVFRKSCASDRRWMEGVIGGDIALLLALGDCGELFYINKTMSSYRLHGNGVSQNYFGDWMGRWFSKSVTMIECFDRETEFKYSDEVKLFLARKLKGYSASFQNSIPTFSPDFDPVPASEAYEEKVSQLLGLLNENQKASVKNLSDLYEPLKDRLTDFGNKHFSEGNMQAARKCYLLARRRGSRSVRNLWFLLSTYIPVIR